MMLIISLVNTNSSARSALIFDYHVVTLLHHLELVEAH